jgi:hypothetical protein
MNAFAVEPNESDGRYRADCHTMGWKYGKKRMPGLDGSCMS